MRKHLFDLQLTGKRDTSAKFARSNVFHKNNIFSMNYERESHVTSRQSIDQLSVISYQLSES